MKITRQTELLKGLVGVSLLVSLAACAEQAAPYLAESQELAPDVYATEALSQGQYARAAAQLEATASEDPLAKLNLALAYSNMDRADDALALYEEILAGPDNPYVTVTRAQAPMRVKTIASRALATLSTR